MSSVVFVSGSYLPFHGGHDPDGAALLRLVVVLVVADGGGVGHDDVVRRGVRLPVRVAAVAAAERRRAVAGRVRAQHVLELGEQVGLVERRPEPHPVAERPEADVRVVRVLLPA